MVFKGVVQARAMIRWMLLTGCRRDEARLRELMAADTGDTQ